MKGVLVDAVKRLNKEMESQNQSIEKKYNIKGIKHFISMNSRGKKIRGNLVLLAYILQKEIKSAADIPQKVITLAACLEILQTSILVQDDVIDGSENRRDLSAFHKKLIEDGCDERKAEAAAVIMGNIGVCHAAELIRTTLSDDSGLIEEFENMLYITLKGEALDISIPLLDKGEKRVERKSCSLEISELKTANYSFASPLMMGFMLATPNLEAEYNWARQTGINLGIAYQLQNDIQSVIRMRDGGKISEDIRRYRMTYMNSLLAENDAIRKILLEGIENEDEDKQRILQYIEKNELIQKVEAKRNEFQQAALLNMKKSSGWARERIAFFTDTIDSFF